MHLGDKVVRRAEILGGYLTWILSVPFACLQSWVAQPFGSTNSRWSIWPTTCVRQWRNGRRRVNDAAIGVQGTSQQRPAVERIGATRSGATSRPILPARHAHRSDFLSERSIAKFQSDCGGKSSMMKSSRPGRRAWENRLIARYTRDLSVSILRRNRSC